jgi:hypothetical protein
MRPRDRGSVAFSGNVRELLPTSTVLLNFVRAQFWAI